MNEVDLEKCKPEGIFNGREMGSAHSKEISATPNEEGIDDDTRQNSEAALHSERSASTNGLSDQWADDKTEVEMKEVDSSASVQDVRGVSSDVATLLLEKMEILQLNMGNLEKDFQGKLKYDQHKEKIIDNLHRELQDYKNDIHKRLLQPMILDMIHLIDDIRKLSGHYRKKEVSEVGPGRLLKDLESIPSDLEDILYRQGVEPFICSGDIFNPAKQRVMKTIETSDQMEDKLIHERLRPGYEWEEKVIRPEMVVVKTYRSPTVQEERSQSDE